MRNPGKDTNRRLLDGSRSHYRFRKLDPVARACCERRRRTGQMGQAPPRLVPQRRAPPPPIRKAARCDGEGRRRRLATRSHEDGVRTS